MAFDEEGAAEDLSQLAELSELEGRLQAFEEQMSNAEAAIEEIKASIDQIQENYQPKCARCVPGIPGVSSIAGRSARGGTFFYWTQGAGLRFTLGFGKRFLRMGLRSMGVPKRIIGPLLILLTLIINIIARKVAEDVARIEMERKMEEEKRARAEMLREAYKGLVAE